MKYLSYFFVLFLFYSCYYQNNNSEINTPIIKRDSSYHYFLNKYSFPKITHNKSSNISRFNHLLHSSTLENPSRIKVQFYGQSIIEGLNYKNIINELNLLFPSVIFEIKFNPIGGFTAPNLKRTAPHDLYYEYADLVVFHAYTENKTEDLDTLFYQLKTNSTSEVLVLNHHYAYFQNPEKAQQRTEQDNIQSNQIKGLVNKYNYELLDIRKYWKTFIELNDSLTVKSLIKDHLHPNEKGNSFIEYCIVEKLKQKVNYNSKNSGITIQKTEKVLTNNHEFVYNFKGNRIDINIESISDSSELLFFIDEMLPSQHKNAYLIQRPSSCFEFYWPGIRRVTYNSEILPIEELWEVKLFNFNRNTKSFDFSLYGTKTGQDGHGNSHENFISNSKRIKFEKEDFMIFKSESVSGKKTPENFKFYFIVKPLFYDSYKLKGKNEIRIIQGINNSTHSLTIKVKKGKVNLHSIKVYNPSIY